MATGTANPTDTKWGYRVGVDGLVDIAEAAKLLGGVHRRTVERMAKDGLLRRCEIGRAGKQRGRIKICRRSLMDYIRSTER
jgi:excisionase family DNA binding protein